jgi:hypothetical protein
MLSPAANLVAVATNLSDIERGRLATALTAVCRQIEVDPAGAELIRYTMNAVYRLDEAGVVIRMTTGPGASALVTRVAEVAAAFADLDLPTTRLAPGIRQPVHADGWSATVWTLLPQPPGHRFAPLDLAAPLRAIHAVTDLPVTLPPWNPVAKARRRLKQAESLDAAGQRFLHEWADTIVGTALDTIFRRLRQWCDKLDTALGEAEWTLPRAVIHGDAHAGNLLLADDGRVVLGDLDSVAIGPPEWDLTPAAHGTTRFGDDPGQYRAFAHAYGLDVTACPAWDLLRRIRELQLVTSVIANLPGRPDVADELAHRLRSSLSDGHSVVWNRFR